MITPLFGIVHFKTNYNYRLSNHCFINELILVTYALISNAVEKGAFGIASLRENGILKTDTKEKANICNRQFQSAFTREGDSDPPSKGASLFSPMGDITVDPKGVAKLLDGLNVHKAPGPDGLNARVLKECSNEISPILALIFNESLARGDVPDEWRQANVPRTLMSRFIISGSEHMYRRY